MGNGILTVENRQQAEARADVMDKIRAEEQQRRPSILIALSQNGVNHKEKLGFYPLMET